MMGKGRNMPGKKTALGALKPVTRDRKAESQAAKDGLARRVGNIAAARRDGTLGEDYIKLAQAMIMCSLPYSQTDKQRVTRRARLGDGTYLSVTFNANLPGVPLPFGADRKLLAWIFDRAIRSDSPFIPWSSASEYQREMGFSMSGRSNQQLATRFERIAGLSIAVQRQAEGKNGIVGYTIIAQANLPSSIGGRIVDANQTSLPGLEDRYGIRLNADLHADIKRHNVVLPRMLWRQIEGPTQVQDIAFWLVVRCYSAMSDTVIPWSALQEQFSNESDTNPRRLKVHARQAISILRELWPEAMIGEVENGIAVTRVVQPLLPDDPMKGRVRRLTR